MTWGLAGAFLAAVAYGAATVLQAVGARAMQRSDAPDARLLAQLTHSLPYVCGISLDGVGFLLSLAALRTEPLFTVQAIVSSSLAVTALLAVLVLGARPLAVEWAGLLVVTSGLVLLAMSAAPQKPSHISYLGRLGLFLGVVAVALVTVTAARRRALGSTREAFALGALAGLMFGAGGVGARVVARPDHLVKLLSDPALWALVIAGVLGLMLYAMALQRGSVTVATSAVVVTETLAPAAIGVTLLGDHPAHGRTALAALGFALTVSGSLALARYGEAPSPAAPSPSTPEAQLADRSG